MSVEELGDCAGGYSVAAFADREAEADVHRDGLLQFHAELDGVARVISPRSMPPETSVVRE